MSVVAIGADHRGFLLKSKIIEWLNENNFLAIDLGTSSEARCDALDFAVRLAEEVRRQPATFGVLVCGSGQAMAMTANRYRHLRAALCHNSTVARLTRQHNDANVLVLGADMIGPVVALDCLETFLTTPFLGGRYAERCEKLTALGGL